MNLEVFLGRLHSVKRYGTGWMARCPAHEDKTSSLSIAERNGKLLLHCFGGCTTEAVCEAMGIRVSQLFSTPPSRKLEPEIVREAQRVVKSPRSRLTPRDRERPVSVIFTDEQNLESAMARALALALEGELVQIAFK